MSEELTRREFLKVVAGGAAAAGLAARASAAEPAGIPRRPLGKTGYVDGVVS